MKTHAQLSREIEQAGLARLGASEDKMENVLKKIVVPYAVNVITNHDGRIDDAKVQKRPGLVTLTITVFTE